MTLGIITKLRRVRVWTGHALLMAFVLKALIPVGFMPDFSGTNGQSFKIVICTAQGTKVVDADAEGHPQPGSAGKYTGEPCAMGALAALTLPDLAVTDDLQIFEALLFRPLSVAVFLPPARAGPAHSPRAPPFLG